jgi:hypothetical protein
VVKQTISNSHRIKAVGSFSRCKERRIIMKKQAYTVIAMVVLMGSMAVAAQAQNGGRPLLRVNIPFQFNVGNKTMPAGDYLVRSVTDESANVVLKLQSRDGKASAMLLMTTVEGKAKGSGMLTFNRYGNLYFFAQAWVGGEITGWQATKSRAERAVQRELAGIKPTAETVALKSR